MTNEHYFHDITLGGLQGCFQYVVRPVWLDGSEGGVTKVLNVEPRLQAGTDFPQNPGYHCKADLDTANMDEFWHYPSKFVNEPPCQSNPWCPITVPTQVEMSRINAAPRGTGSAQGPPPAPANVKVRFADFEQGLFGSEGTCTAPLDPAYCNYPEYVRNTLYTAVTWDANLSSRPLDLAGYHVEMAGSPDGPWRRLTPQPVAWWESGYHVLGLGVRRYPLNNPPEYSGHPECWHFRVIAVDQGGWESAPALPFQIVGQPGQSPPPSCPQTLPAPQGLRASYLPEPGCETHLEWDAVDDAAEYHVYRATLGINGGWGFFFYETQMVPGNQPSYDEDGDPSASSSNVNEDCPVGLYYWDCDMNNLSAYYVTARGATGGESPRSNIVFWNAGVPVPGGGFGCDNVPPYARLAPQSTPVEMFAAADAWPKGNGFATCDVSTEVAASTGAPQPAAEELSPFIAPLLTLGQSVQDPPYKVLDMHVDHLGSTRLVTNEQGYVESQHTFFPFGEEVAPVQARYPTKLFTGHERDQETGLDYMLARYYGSSLGRFLSTDPVTTTRKNLRRPQRWNRYVYALNNPLKFIDPNGEDPYLVARPLGGNPDSKIAHMFVVTNAQYAGDPNATVHSWGMKDNGNMGRVDEKTQNKQSKGTQEADKAAWKSLAQPGSSSSATPIPASDQKADQSANAVMENKDYAATGIGGVNSNSAAQAVANDAAGEEVEAPGDRRPVGAGSADEVDFDKNQDGEPDPKSESTSTPERRLDDKR